MATKLTTLDSHFAFGKNWEKYSGLIDSPRVRAAQLQLANMLGCTDLSGKSFLDIGSGSGIHSLAALNLGAKSVMAVDIDPDSVSTTQKVLSKFAPSARWCAREASVFDLKQDELGDFDVVYSWGVLHHTGDLDRAISCATKLVAQDGLLALALYRPVWLDWFWKAEKRWYTSAPCAAQAWAQNIYMAALMIPQLATGISPSRYRADYAQRRGMSIEHDVHDWLGGWPYESISRRELDARLISLGFDSVVLPRPTSSQRIGAFRRAARSIGLLGSGCDEYLYRRVA